jgi:Spy/CpxP family protein refolding chaperone
MEMCRKIDEKNTELHALLAATNVITPEISRALAESAQLRVECQQAMLGHFYEMAQVMPPEQGKRYLTWVQQETLMPGQRLPQQPPPSTHTP